MILPALCSVTFRQLTPPEIISLAARCGLKGIEWGADVHVPPDDLAKAYDVQQMTADAGLSMPVYGSYYRVGDNFKPNGQTEPSFEDVCDAAVALGASSIRVWAGRSASQSASASYFGRVVEDMVRICDIAAQADIEVVCEFHRNTLTDNEQSTMKLVSWVGHPNMKLHWQPQTGASANEGIHELKTFAPLLSHVHVFHWVLDHTQPDPFNVPFLRRPLAEGAVDWQIYLDEINTIATNQNRLIYAMLEFLHDPTPECLSADVNFLNLCLSKFKADK
jgi:sugar phosphate isomerase/epimerase